MKVTVALNEYGMLPDAYGKYAPAQDRDDERMSARSFPFTVEDVPAGTRALAWVFLDWDSIPVCGLPWIHWAAWYDFGLDGDPVARLAIPDDASRTGLPGLHQGHTSHRDSRGVFGVGYQGPCPPDKDHVYTMWVLALDKAPTSVGADGAPFWANELVAAARGHALAEARAFVPSRS
ncbi:YbhB/YbcL family Raf kinase inhibitor-like protein [bacterium]|nr:YbhB/YbcL family Raf kinase inhibitor-like protein [bacterium]